MTAVDPPVPGQSVTLTGTVAWVKEHEGTVAVDVVRRFGSPTRIVLALSAVSSAPDGEVQRLRDALQRIADPERWGDWHPSEVACLGCGSAVVFRFQYEADGSPGVVVPDDVLDTFVHSDACPVFIARGALAAVPADDATEEPR